MKKIINGFGLEKSPSKFIYLQETPAGNNQIENIEDEKEKVQNKTKLNLDELKKELYTKPTPEDIQRRIEETVNEALKGNKPFVTIHLAFPPSYDEEGQELSGTYMETNSGSSPIKQVVQGVIDKMWEAGYVKQSGEIFLTKPPQYKMTFARSITPNESITLEDIFHSAKERKTLTPEQLAALEKDLYTKPKPTPEDIQKRIDEEVNEALKGNKPVVTIHLSFLPSYMTRPGYSPSDQVVQGIIDKMMEAGYSKTKGTTWFTNPPEHELIFTKK